MAMAKQIKMTDSQFAKMRKIVYDRAGIWFSDAKKYVLESRLSRRLEELEMDDFDQYCVFLTIGPYREDEFQEMFNRSRSTRRASSATSPNWKCSSGRS